MKYNLNATQKKHFDSISTDSKKGQEFSYYLCSTLLKQDINLINDFYIDGSDDRGIDFVHIMTNGEISSFESLREKIQSNAVRTINISIFQCKNESKETSSISENELEKISSFFSSLERVCKSQDSTIISNKRLLKFVEILRLIYESQHNLGDIYFEYIYINTVIAFNDFQSEKIKNDVGKNIEATLKKLYSNLKVSYETYSKTTIKNLFSKYQGYKKFLYEFESYIEDEEDGGTLALVKVNSLLKCLSNADKTCTDLKNIIEDLNDSIFDINVRSFLGKNKVNKYIIETCEMLIREKPDKNTISFWKKNNGITILCDSYHILPNNVVELNNIKIINGLQTIASILEYLKTDQELTMNDLKKIKLHIKIISKQGLTDEDIESIIIATNSQSQVKYIDLISINEDLRNLEFKLYDNRIDYQRKRKQTKKSDCDYIIKNNELIQLIITCFKNGPSAAKNNLEKSLYSEQSEAGENMLIDFKPYWDSNKFNQLMLAIQLYSCLKEKQKQDKENAILRFAKLHTIYCLTNCINTKTTNDDNIDRAIKIMQNVFTQYSIEIGKELNIEHLSKSISKDYIKKIIYSNKLLEKIES